MNKRMRPLTSLISLTIFVAVLTACAAQSTPAATPTEASAVPIDVSTPTAIPAPTLPSGWETYTASAGPGTCGYTIDHPSDMEGSSEGDYAWTLNRAISKPSGPVLSFIYISVIPDDFQSSEPGVIYNYDPAETQTLLNLQVGTSGSQHADSNFAESFTYTRLPDTTLDGQAAQTYENTQPWEFPVGTKEIRYYLKGNGCTYLIGGYLVPAGSEDAVGINEGLFNQIIATFRQS